MSSPVRLIDLSDSRAVAAEMEALRARNAELERTLHDIIDYAEECLMAKAVHRYAVRQAKRLREAR